LIELLSNAYDLAAIMDLEFSTDILYHIFEVEKERVIWSMYLARFTNMTKDDFIDYESYKKSLFPERQSYTRKTDEEIIAEMSQFAKRGELK
jgi:hypothetical protein